MKTTEDTHDWIAADFMKTGSLFKCSKCGKPKIIVYRNSDFKCEDRNKNKISRVVRNL